MSNPNEERDPQWNQKLAALALLEIVKNPYVSAVDRLAAINELNVVYGLGEFDRNGRFRPYPEKFAEARGLIQNKK